MKKVRRKRTTSVPKKPPKSSDFDKRLEDWETWLRAAKETPWQEYDLVLKPDFFRWVETTIKKTRDILKELFDRYEMSPSEILTRLVMYKIWSLPRDAVISGKWIDGPKRWVRPAASDMSADQFTRKLRSLKLRDRDAKVLEKAAAVLLGWKPFFAPLTVIPFPNHDALTKFAILLRNFAPAQRYRPQEWLIKACAEDLAALIRKRTKTVHYRMVGRLIQAGLHWLGPYSNVEQAIKKLIKRKILPEDTIWLHYGGFFPWGGLTLKDYARPHPITWFDCSLTRDYKRKLEKETLKGLSELK